jgi:nitric oxide reductase activation protein
MTIELNEYFSCVAEGKHEHWDVLESSYQEATRVMSPRGLQNYLEGIKAMCAMGRGQDVVLTYVQEMPAVVVLMDLSESTNEHIDKENEDSPTVLQLTREATGLLAWAIDSIGDPFAVHGFASDGRHDVQYYRFKDFKQPYEDEAKSRMAGMKGGLSTRMGAALRHAGDHLLKQSSQRKLVLLITDGEPADIDERDPQYLRHDARKAVEELARIGVYTYCLTLDPQADRYVSRIFGENRYSIVDRVEKLPERLPAVFAAITG